MGFPKPSKDCETRTVTIPEVVCEDVVESTCQDIPRIVSEGDSIENCQVSPHFRFVCSCVCNSVFCPGRGWSTQVLRGGASAPQADLPRHRVRDRHRGPGVRAAASSSLRGTAVPAAPPAASRRAPRNLSQCQVEEISVLNKLVIKTFQGGAHTGNNLIVTSVWARP